MSESTELQRAVENLTSSISELRKELVRKDVYESDQRGVAASIDALKAGVIALGSSVEKIEERRAADRKLMLSQFVLPLALIIIQLYLASRGVTPS